MKLEILGDRRRPKILLIHPSVADSRCFAPLFPYLEDYCLILPTLGGHDITSSDDYRGARAEAQALYQALTANGISALHALCAESLGCVVGWELLQMQRLKIRRIVFDGAPFAQFGTFTRLINFSMTMLLVRRAQRTPEKLQMIDERYPEVGSSMKEVLAHYRLPTVKRIVHDALGGVQLQADVLVATDDLLMLYGSEDPFRRGLDCLRDASVPFRQMILEGYDHCAYPLKEPEAFCRLLTE